MSNDDKKNIKSEQKNQPFQRFQALQRANLLNNSVIELFLAAGELRTAKRLCAALGGCFDYFADAKLPPAPLSMTD